MACIAFPGGILCVGGPERVIEVAGKRWTFEMTYPGPAVLNRDGSVKAQQPGERSPFWTAVSLWAQQGERVGADGLCVWDPLPDPFAGYEVVRISKRACIMRRARASRERE